MTVRGAFMYPMFIALAHFISPWALLFGVGCLLQGIIYYLSATVLEAEYIMGGLNGFMLAAILFQKIFYS